MAPLHLSRIFYKSTFLCKTNPILSAVGGLQMNVNLYNTTDYENIANWTLGQNKPNSNPIKANYCGFLLDFIPHIMRGRNDNAGG